MKNKEITKKIILSKAYYLFLTRNVERVTIVDIEEAISLTRGAVYYYYKDKVELFINVVDEYFFPIFDNPHLDSYKDMSLLCFLKAYNSPSEKFMKQIDTMYPDIDPCISYYHFIFQCLQYYPDFKLHCKNAQTKQLLLWKEVIIRAQKQHVLDSNIDYAPYIYYLANTNTSIMFHSIFNIDSEVTSKEFLKFTLFCNSK